MSHRAVLPLARGFGSKMLTWFCCLPSHMESIVSFFVWIASPAVLTTLNTCFPHTAFLINQEGKCSRATTSSERVCDWRECEQSFRELWYKKHPSIREYFFLIKCTYPPDFPPLGLQWLMSSEEELVSLMDFHIHKRSFQSHCGMVSVGIWSDTVMMCLTLGEVLSQSPSVPGSVEVLRCSQLPCL